jgi:hypothetical protein
VTYDDWKTTNPADADYCGNGHYHCRPCPVDELANPHCPLDCDHTSEDMEPEAQKGEPGCRGKCCPDGSCSLCRAVTLEEWTRWKRAAQKGEVEHG